MDVKTGLECVISDIKSFLLSAIKKDIRHPVMTLGSASMELSYGHM